MHIKKQSGLRETRTPYTKDVTLSRSGTLQEAERDNFRRRKDDGDRLLTNEVQEFVDRVVDAHKA